MLKEEEGGRHKPFFTGYRPQAFMRTADSSVNITLDDGVAMAMPGDNINCHLKLNVPLTIEIGTRFALREGGRTVGAGVITEIIPDTKEDIKEEEDRANKKN